MQNTFKPTFLYVKTHNITGFKYFGKTIKENVQKYRGSGTHWLRHIRKHGYDVTTEIIGYYIDKDECVAAALKFSIENDIINSLVWANLINENGLDGGGAGGLRSNSGDNFRILNAQPKTEQQRKYISDVLTGRPSPKKGKPSVNKGRVIPEEKRGNMRGPKEFRRICRLSDRKEMSVNAFSRWTKN